MTQHLTHKELHFSSGGERKIVEFYLLRCWYCWKDTHWRRFASGHGHGRSAGGQVVGGWAFKWMDIGNWTGGAGGGILWNCKIKPGGSSGEDTTRWTGEQPCRWTVRRGGNR